MSDADEADKLYAPWTAKQRLALARYQHDGSNHPYTCPQGHGPLIPSSLSGWWCRQPRCSYTQDWAWRAHSESRPAPPWPSPSEESVAVRFTLEQILDELVVLSARIGRASIPYNGASQDGEPLDEVDLAYGHGMRHAARIVRDRKMELEKAMGSEGSKDHAMYEEPEASPVEYSGKVYTTTTFAQMQNVAGSTFDSAIKSLDDYWLTAPAEFEAELRARDITEDNTGWNQIAAVYLNWLQRRGGEAA